MADDIQFSITGLDSLLGKIDNIKQETRRKTGRAALRKAALLVRDAAKANAGRVNDPKTEPNIAENIAARFSNKYHKRTGNLMWRIGVMGGAGGGKKGSLDGLPGKDTRHWRFKEFGTEKMAADPFMRPALESNIGEATDTFVREFEKGIDRAIKRAIKKGTTA